MVGAIGSGSGSEKFRQWLRDLASNKRVADRWSLPHEISYSMTVQRGVLTADHRDQLDRLTCEWGDGRHGHSCTSLAMDQRSFSDRSRDKSNQRDLRQSASYRIQRGHSSSECCLGYSYSARQ